jgi:hypothetical protein
MWDGEADRVERNDGWSDLLIEHKSNMIKIRGWDFGCFLNCFFIGFVLFSKLVGSHPPNDVK